ncbi:VOC family protein [Enterococcus sp. 669A]|uniref:VOC family protein n=1 Tax=Candidatus Enterococcus moelleringii TaxID=2815325 RepID=A0ABS3L7I5_9ENTE|nr:VOC family protein [Enterococcus sp. 669A]MBO1305587.1 VOC family protein [Enterococcus sp. 669A]
MTKAYIEHTAVFVTDVEWYVEFFHQTLGFTERLRKEEPGQPKQVWLYGGIQLIEGTENQDSGKLGHLGIMVDDQQAVLKKINRYPVKPLPQGENWLQLPDGLCIEILQAAPGSIEEVLQAKPW